MPEQSENLCMETGTSSRQGRGKCMGQRRGGIYINSSKPPCHCNYAHIFKKKILFAQVTMNKMNS